MDNGTTSQEQPEAEKAEKSGWAKWDTPLVLLLLAFTFLVMLILSNRSQAALNDGGFVIYVLTALLCTLVAVSIILIGCAERTRETERHMRSLSTNITRSRNELLRVGQSGLRANEQISAKISSLGEGQRMLQEQISAKISGLGEDQRSLRDRLSELNNAIGKENQLLRKTGQTYKQQLDEKIAALALDQQKMLTRIDSLEQAGMSISQQITETGDNQESLWTTMKERADSLGGRMSDMTTAQEKLHDHVDSLRKLIQAIAADISNIAQEQATLHEAVETKSAESARHLETLSQDHRNVHNHLDYLGENVRNVGDEVTETIAQRVASREALQAFAEALTAKLSGLAAAHEQLHGHADGLRELIQTVAGDVTDVAREQSTLHEAIENRGAESMRRLETLSQDHSNVRNHLDHLGENIRNVGDEVTETIARRVASHEDLQAYAEALAGQLSGLASAQDRLESSLNVARANIEKVSAEQASLDGTLQDNTSIIATTMGLFEQFQQALNAEIGDLVQECQRTVESIESMAAEQASFREIAGSRNDELTVQIAAFSDDEKAALAAFSEDLKQATTSVEAIAHKQDNIENAVSDTYQESLDRLGAITEGQELWARKLEANEAQVNAMVADIGNLQQQVGAVLEMLNTCVQGLTDVLDSNNKHQLKLEDTVNQNLTTSTELISQVEANRAFLQAQCEQ